MSSTLLATCCGARNRRDMMRDRILKHAAFPAFLTIVAFALIRKRYGRSPSSARSGAWMAAAGRRSSSFRSDRPSSAALRSAGEIWAATYISDRRLRLARHSAGAKRSALRSASHTYRTAACARPIRVWIRSV